MHRREQATGPFKQEGIPIYTTPVISAYHHTLKDGERNPDCARLQKGTKRRVLLVQDQAD
jgi:hypothetical protein